LAQAIENMSRAPPSSLISPQFEQQSSSLNIPLPPPPPSSHSFQPPQQAPVSILQRAIQQSDQQFNTNQTTSSMSNGFNNIAPFQPFDLLPPNNYPGFPVVPILNQVPILQQSPIQPNNIPINSPQTMSSPSNVFHNSPPSQTQAAQQMNSPRMSGGSTLQFVPSQVLRKMSKSHK
jgi:hypothetical protein